MTTASVDKISALVFSKTFEQMCNFIAVAKTGDSRETIKGLITLCLLELPEDRLNTSEQFRETIETLFGLSIPLVQIDESLHELERTGAISKVTTNYKLSQNIIDTLKKKIDEANALEERVKSTWFLQLQATYPTLPLQETWKTLRDYLSRTFRRHGIQAAALLDPTVDTPAEHDMSLSSILRESIQGHLPAKLHKIARPAITDFLATVGTDADRAHYVAQLADGAFNFYTLEVPHELSSKLRSQLNELTIFLDTNFLFGILDLHYNTQVQVSHDLIRAISSQKFPFKLRYHEATGKEMAHTIDHYGSILRSRTWTHQLSHAAAQTRNISGIEQTFHVRNARQSIDVDEFLRPYEHFDQLLKAKEIKIFSPCKEREQARIDLFHDYQEFLNSNNRGDKPYETVMHDATVLEEARNMRTKAASTLDSGALIITCDYYLYRFDWESSRRNGHHACVLLPNIFWQILRPFITVDQDFEKAFAETFALPAFRALGSGGSKACSRMLQILATYKDVPEQTAFKLLSNDLLLDRLKTVSDEKQFIEQVEAAFVEENKYLMEEKAYLAKQLSEEKQLREKRELDLSTAELTIKQKEQALIEQEKSLQEKEAALHMLAQQKEEDSLKVRETAEQVYKEQKDREDAETRNNQLLDENTTIQKRMLLHAKITSVIIGVLVVVLFEIVVNSVIKWNWLLLHQNSYGLQGCISLMAFFGITGAWVKQWRKVLWIVGLFGVIFVFLQILGGAPSK